MGQVCEARPAKHEGTADHLGGSIVRVIRLLAIPVLASVTAVPAMAEGAAFVPNLRNEQTWFACGADKVDNVRRQEAKPVPTWDTTAPTQSVRDGAGCASVDSPFTQSASDNIYDTTFEGTFTGNLDTLTVEAHSIYVGPARNGGAMTVGVRLLVDGEAVVISPDGISRLVQVTPVPSSTRLSERVRLSITDIGFVAETEDAEHIVTLLLHNGQTLSTGPTVTDMAGAWVWDTTEVPSGITFNPATLETARVAAQRVPVEE